MDFKFPPLPPQKRNFTQARLQSIIKIIKQQPTPKTIDINSVQGNQSCKSQSGRSSSSNNRGRPLTSSSRTSSQSHSRAKSSKNNKIGSTNQLLNDGSHYLKLPKITAKSWILFEMRQQRCLYGLRHFKRRQIASLTKMLNLITILNLVEELSLNPKKIKARASPKASTVIGTTAQIKQNGLYCLQDLYYGMMLPSGNDAATMIAQIGGCIVKSMENDNKDWKSFQDPDYLTTYIKKQGATSVGTYLRQMNRLGREIGLTNTNLANPHGLSNTSSLSTANDLAKLCTFAMKNTIFRKVVNTQTYSYSYQAPKQKITQADKQNFNPNKMIQVSQKRIVNGSWTNTNKMLGQGWSGIKTGITPNAGPCLAASCQKVISGRQYEFLIILLNSESMEARWNEVRSLMEWIKECKLYE